MMVVMVVCIAPETGSSLPPASSSPALYPAAELQISERKEGGHADICGDRLGQHGASKIKRSKKQPRVRRLKNQTDTAARGRNKCMQPGCTTLASYGDISNKVAVACAKHRKEGHVDVKNRRCSAILWDGSQCTKLPTFALPHERIPRQSAGKLVLCRDMVAGCCLLHSPPGYVNVKRNGKRKVRRCQAIDCNKVASFGNMVQDVRDKRKGGVKVQGLGHARLLCHEHKEVVFVLRRFLSAFGQSFASQLAQEMEQEWMNNRNNFIRQSCSHQKTFSSFHQRNNKEDWIHSQDLWWQLQEAAHWDFEGAMNGCSFSEPNSITNYVWMHPESMWRPTWDAGKTQEEEEEEEEEEEKGRQSDEKLPLLLHPPPPPSAVVQEEWELPLR
ncbi:hypothetical protein GUITHDRAFT_133742 [Guillardia theta CCMP2712]|uniref:Uncharacterized protein n=1 Tax=Guillardia theta (strain CCMP2712) TaxID=905079 RepID=L1JVW2_GUITC|nr:hypothetical protein GUITHDRAFT_133742 [Guillardia theta CCMP2712]EKX52721.1 hypothetical protein GUITHDRAFT_133742 [Guillardia theta CCMP2712]|eukprot:XP_005839701.1 hypothetical protein GUITHDRAFT_133742 [Guillardia theta CCMP2712]